MGNLFLAPPHSTPSSRTNNLLKMWPTEDETYSQSLEEEKRVTGGGEMGQCHMEKVGGDE